LLLTPGALAKPDNFQELHFHEVNTLFPNPGEGFMSGRFPSTVTYLRFNWQDVEPSNGLFNWKYIDDAIARSRAHGANIAMRVMTASAHTPGYYCSPKWLFDLGCKGYPYIVGGDDPTSGGRRIPRIEPDYGDPIYLAKHGEFIAALGKRYDGDPDVEFLDIGSYGIWGEWHTPHPVSFAVRRQIIDMYLQAFHKTPLVGMVDDAEGLDYTLAHGGGYRCDGVGSPQIQSRWMPLALGINSFYPEAELKRLREAWKHAPIVFEWYGDYDYLRSKDWSYRDAIKFMLSNHVSIINDNLGRVPPAAMPQLQMLARLAGYRFVLRAVGVEKSAPRGGTVDVNMHWANVGVGKLYRCYQLRVALCNTAGKTVAAIVAKTNPREWLPGVTDVAAQIIVPSGIPSGKYQLTVALVDPGGIFPPLRLAIDAPNTDGWYQVGQVTID
jgi:hypothetical protein